jgi:hypothetical protein
MWQDVSRWLADILIMIDWAMFLVVPTCACAFTCPLAVLQILI